METTSCMKPAAVEAAAAMEAAAVEAAAAVRERGSAQCYCDQASHRGNSNWPHHAPSLCNWLLTIS